MGENNYFHPCVEGLCRRESQPRAGALKKNLFRGIVNKSFDHPFSNKGGRLMRFLYSGMALIVAFLLSNQAVAATQYEAENATLSGAAKKNTNHPGYTGTGFVDGFYYSTTAQASFAVTMASAGSATVTLRYSAGNGTSSNTGLYVNGTKIKNITCNTTSNWDTWANQVETVTLNAGNNTIAYKAETSVNTCINLDYISVQEVTTTYALTVTATNGTVTKSPNATTYTSGTVVSLTAVPATGYQFTGWSGDLTGTANPASITMNSAKNVTANFTSNPLTLTMSNDGHGSTTPATSAVVTYGVPAAISATPATGYTFSTWTVTAGSATFGSATSASTTVTLTTSATIRANFIATTPTGVSAVTYAEISSPVTVTADNTIVLALPFTAPSAGYVTVTATGLYGTTQAYSHEQRGLESFITLNSTSGGSLSGFVDKPNVQNGALYVSETAGFQVSAGSNTVRLIVSPRTTLIATAYKFVKCRMTVVFSQQKM
jgi:uncharacterized repeat protein (TIGR02543 family)